MPTTIEDPTPSRELWDQVWQRSTLARPAHTPIIAALQRALPLEGARILEVGCGSAVDSATMAALGAQVFGLDFSISALGHARSYAERAGVVVEVMAGDTFALPYRTGSFDLIFSQGLLEHFPDPRPAIHEQIRALRPGGILCVDVPQTWTLRTPYKRWKIARGTWFAGWETDYSLGRLVRLLSDSGLEIIDSYGWMYVPALLYGLRNLHTLGERYNLPFWLSQAAQGRVEAGWASLERQRWYYRWLGCIGVVARKPGEV